MILPNEVEERLLSIEQEYAARERLKSLILCQKEKYFSMVLQDVEKL